MDLSRKHIVWSVLIIALTVVWILIIAFQIRELTYDEDVMHKSINTLTNDTIAINECPDEYRFLYYLNLEQCLSLEEIAKNECISPKVCLSHCPIKSYSMLDEDDETKREIWNNFKDVIVCVTDKLPQTYEEFLQMTEAKECFDNAVKSNPFDNEICLPYDLDENRTKHLKPVNGSYRNKVSMGIKDTLARKSQQMFNVWIISASILTVIFITVYFVFFLFCVKFAVYFFLVNYTLTMLTTLIYSIIATYLAYTKPDLLRNYDFTLDVHWGMWLGATLIFATLLIFFFEFLNECYYFIPKAVQFLVYVNKGIGGLKGSVLVLLIAILTQILLVAGLLFAVSVSYTLSKKTKIIVNLSEKCVCLNGYQEGSSCTNKEFDIWCRDSVSGERCSGKSCMTIGVSLSDANLGIIIFASVTTYYLLWLVKCSTNMIVGTTFVNWYRHNFSTKIPLWHYWKVSLYCFKHHLGTLAFGSLIMSIIGPFHSVIQSFEYITLIKMDFKNNRRKNKLYQLLNTFSKITSPLIFIEAAVFDISYWKASKKVDQTMMSRIRSTKLINKIVDYILHICSINIILKSTVVLLIIYLHPSVFIEKEIYVVDIMLLPLYVCIVIVGIVYFISSNFLSLYSVSVNALYLSYISDQPAEVSRKRKYRSTHFISRDIDPDKYEVLVMTNDYAQPHPPQPEESQ